MGVGTGGGPSEAEIAEATGDAAINAPDAPGLGGPVGPSSDVGGGEGDETLAGGGGQGIQPARAEDIGVTTSQGPFGLGPLEILSTIATAVINPALGVKAVASLGASALEALLGIDDVVNLDQLGAKPQGRPTPGRPESEIPSRPVEEIQTASGAITPDSFSAGFNAALAERGQDRSEEGSSSDDAEAAAASVAGTQVASSDATPVEAPPPDTAAQPRDPRRFVRGAAPARIAFLNRPEEELPRRSFIG